MTYITNTKLRYPLTRYFKNIMDIFISRSFFGIFLYVFLFPQFGAAQVGINTTDIDFSAIFEIKSTNKGVLFPSLTIDERDAINAMAISAGKIVPPGLTIYCLDCCQNGTGSLYYYNGVDWKSMDSGCVDLNAGPSCFDLSTTIISPNHMDNSNTPPLLIDGNTTLASQNSGEIAYLRMHKTDDDNVQFDFPEDIPAGYKIRIYFNDYEDAGNIGIYASPRNGPGNDIGQNADTLGSLNGANLTGTGSDNYILTITLNSIADNVFVRSSDDDRDHIVLLEIKLFDSNDVEIPLSCN